MFYTCSYEVAYFNVQLLLDHKLCQLKLASIMVKVSVKKNMIRENTSADRQNRHKTRAHMRGEEKYT